jgi:hypothetical protein
MLDPSRHEPDRPPRLARAAAVCGASGKVCPAKRATRLLEAIIEPGDRVVIEGDNQKHCPTCSVSSPTAPPRCKATSACPARSAKARCRPRRASASRWRSPSASPLLQQPTDDRP